MASFGTCGITLCSPAQHKVKSCIQCTKREEELNSGVQETIDFEPKSEYSDFFNFSDMKFDGGSFIIHPFVIDDAIVESAAKSLTQAMGDLMVKQDG